MIAIFNGSSDISQYLERDSYSDAEAQNNQRNTASFTMNQNKIGYGSNVYVYETLQLREQASSGQAVLKVIDTFPDTQKFRVGDTIIVRIKTAGEKKYVIDDIDHDALEVTLTANLTETVAKSEYVGRLRFAGTCMKAPEREIGLSGTFTYKVTLADWSSAFDRKLVRDTFEGQYSREITGRVVFNYCANDAEVDMFNFESSLTNAGVALSTSDETTDRIDGAKSQKTGTSGSGTATWSKTFTAADISAMTHARFFWKIAAGDGSKMTSMKLRLGADASNYFEWDIANIGALFEDCWNYESVILNTPASETGSPSLASVSYMAIVMGCNAAISTGNILFDSLFASTGGFTLQNVQRGLSKFTDYRANYKKSSVVIEDLMKSQSMFWYIDYERDIHEYTPETGDAPFDLDDTSQNYYDLEINADISKLVNRIVVRGGEAPGQSLFTQEQVADGVETNYRLPFKPKTLTVYVDTTGTGASYVEKSVGIENITDESTVDFVFSFEEKNVRNANLPVLDAGDLIKFTFYPYLPIIKRIIEPTSVALMASIAGGDGIFDGAPIIDHNIKTFEDAQLRGQAELDQYANPLLTATFKTQIEGLHIGQNIHITDSSRGIDQDFLIQQVRASKYNNDRFTYSITAGTTLFGIVEFLQYLLKKSVSIDSDTHELVDVVVNVDDEMTITDDADYTHHDKDATAASRLVKWFDFLAEEGAVTETGEIYTVGIDATEKKRSLWYGNFTDETGTIQFTASNHNNGKELRITTAVGGTGKEAKARLIQRMPVLDSTDYTVRAWLQILSALTNQGTGAGAKLVVKEYADATTSTVLATNTIFTAKTAIQDFNPYELTFTTNASTNFITIEFSLVAAIGTVSISDIIIEEDTVESESDPMIASFFQAT